MDFEIEEELPPRIKLYEIPTWAKDAVTKLVDGSPISTEVEDSKAAQTLAAKFSNIAKHLDYKCRYVFRPDTSRVYIEFYKESDG